MSDPGTIDQEIAEQIAIHLRINAMSIASGAMVEVLRRIAEMSEDQATRLPADVMDDIYKTIVAASSEVGEGCAHQVISLLRKRGLWNVTGDNRTSMVQAMSTIVREDDALELLQCIYAAYDEGQCGSQNVVRLVVALCPSPAVKTYAESLHYIEERNSGTWGQADPDKPRKR